MWLIITYVHQLQRKRHASSINLLIITCESLGSACIENKRLQIGVQMQRIENWSSPAMHVHRNDCVCVHAAREVQVLSDSNTGHFQAHSWCAIC